MEKNDVELVMEFLRKNGLREAELAREEDIKEKGSKEEGGKEEVEMGSFDFEKFLFVLPPVRIPGSTATPTTSRREPQQEAEDEGGGGGDRLVGLSSGSVSEDEFVSLGSSATGGYSSEFVNPYGLCSSSQANSETSSDRLSQFGTARDYPDCDMQNDLHWYDERDEGEFRTPSFSGEDYFGYQSEDKFIMTTKSGNEYENTLGVYDKSDGFETESNVDYLDKQCLFDTELVSNKVQALALDYNHFDKRNQPKVRIEEDKLDYIHSSSEKSDLNVFELKLGDILIDGAVAHLHVENKATNFSSKELLGDHQIEELKSKAYGMPNGNEDYDVRDSREDGDAQELKDGAEEEGVNADELLINDSQEDGFEVFNLRIIHRKNRTGFEESKELPIVLNTVIAGRYCIMEYLGSAAFSKVIQAHDLHTGMDVCLKIIKNDKDFFDQSLDEIKLLKIVNKHDPADERHILRLYDYFYHQEHLFIACELLKANLYEFQKFNQESGGEAYFTLSRLQVIARQCLEALEYLHHLGIIHCDLKPENILMKSYRRCEIKVIDLGSRCLQSDNLCLYVQSRSYRAPEVILGLPYNEKIDLWSLGCILAELCSGEVLFPNNAVVMILARMIGMFGPIDLYMLVAGQETHKYFSKEYDLYYMNEETDQLEYIIPEESSLEGHLQTSDVGFIDFLRNLLEVNPLRRPTATEALEHPWLSYSYESVS